jgi:uncharacterized protein (TIGR02301 family)
MRQLLIALCLLAVPLAPGPSAAQERAPSARRSLADLAYVLGEAHGLAQVCRPDSQVWRGRMLRLLELETPDGAFRRQLNRAFNDGFESARLRHPVCGRSSRAALSQAAQQGRDLARVLAAAR